MKRDEILQISKPILFNTDMVQSILDGKKTVTRRVIKPQPKFILSYTFAGCNNGTWTYPSDSAYVYWGEEYRLPDFITEDDKKMAWKPPYHTDDILYVRETWQHLYELDGNEQIIEGTGKYYYAATDTLPFNTYVDSMGVTHERVPWRPSIHMPKEAARLFLKVTNVRVERLQEITKEQALSEGVPDDSDYPISKVYCPRCRGEGLIGSLSANLGYMEVDCPDCDTAIKRFKNLWNSTIKKSDLNRYGWDANPWVWVIEFERIEVE